MSQSSTPFVRGEHRVVASRSMLPFRLIDRLGVGATAVVDLVEDKTTGQRFAHKSFPRYYGREPERFEQAFKNEIEIIKRLHSHPHIVQIHWSYAHGMEFGMLLTPVAHDGDLRAYLRDIQDSGNTPTTEQHSVLSRSFGCLASGLEFIHSHTIRHKDIKPQNILVHDGHIIYTDFGIAFDASDQTTTTIGIPEAFTERYCAPEVADWGSRNRKSDIFSLGCVYIEIMAILSSNADLGASDSRPYWERIDDLRSNLIHLGASDSVSGPLFLVFNDMLEPRGADRLDAEDLLQCMRRIQDSHSPLVHKLFCDDCERSSPIALQNTMKEVETVASAHEIEEKYECQSTEERDSSSNDLDFEQYRVRPSQNIITKAAILELIGKPIKFQEMAPKCIYVLWQPHNPEFIVIGSTFNVSQPSLEMELLRTHHLHEYVPQSGNMRARIAYAPRVEQLVATELKNFLFFEYCESCQSIHHGWYRTTPEHAVKVIQKYSNWIATDPYKWDGEVRRLASTDSIETICQPLPFGSSEAEEVE